MSNQEPPSASGSQANQRAANVNGNLRFFGLFLLVVALHGIAAPLFVRHASRVHDLAPARAGAVTFVHSEAMAEAGEGNGSPPPDAAAPPTLPVIRPVDEPGVPAPPEAPTVAETPASPAPAPAEPVDAPALRRPDASQATSQPPVSSL